MNDTELKRLKSLYNFEKLAYRKGYKIIAGIDEAGRGPLAGPVAAAAVILPVLSTDSEFYFWEGLNDSKKLSPQKRENLYSRILECPGTQVGIGIISERFIDRINILKATQLAMRKAVKNLDLAANILLVDGMTIPGIKVDQQKIINGDSKSLSIAAASVVAKVARDRIMCEYHEKYPAYGFSKHKGYGTKEHMISLKTHGPCKIHRRSFQPIALMEEIGYEADRAY